MKYKLTIMVATAMAAFLWAEADLNNNNAVIPQSEDIVAPAEASIIEPAKNEPDTLPELESEKARKTVTELAKPKAASLTRESKQNPDPQYAYQLAIPAIGVNAGVLGMGLTPDGKMAIPANFTEIGWYNLGPRPGEVGNAVLGAHVDNGLPGEAGGNVKGVFKRLKELQIGDEITLTDQSGAPLHFKVTERKIYSYNLADTREVFGSTGKPRLVLITCHGAYMPSLNTYDQRLVVFAELVEN